MRGVFLLRLSSSEKVIMDILWSSGKGMSTQELVDRLPDPKPSYNTTATHLKRLSHKNFVEYKKKDGDKTFYYSPVISRGGYMTRTVVSLALLIVVGITTVGAIVVHIPFFKHLLEPQNNPATVPMESKVEVRDTTSITPIDEPEEEQEVVKQPSVRAEYPGGLEAVQDYFDKATEGLGLPDGRVYLKITIDSKGKVIETKAIMDASTEPELARKAEALALAMPNWTPAKNNGTAVSSTITIPVLFLSEE